MGYPRLADSFFIEYRPQREFFEKWKSAGQFGPHFVPVYEWEGVLFVATSDPTQIRVEGDWCVVQASSEYLNSLWEELNSSQRTSENFESPIVDTTPAAAPTIEPTVVLSSDQLLVDVNLEELETEKPVEESGAEDVLDLNFQEAPQSPEGTASTSGVDLSSLLTASGTQAPTKSEAPMPPPPPPPATHLADQGPVAKTAAPLVDSSARGPFYSIWVELSQKYKHSMILLYREGQILPVQWDPHTSSPNPTSVYTTKNPSPFRTVARTKKSYHGYLVPCETSQAFFQHWNQGAYPGCMTISPIMIGEGLAGFLAAWGENDAYTKESLELVEKCANETSQLILQNPQHLSQAS